MVWGAATKFLMNPSRSPADHLLSFQMIFHGCAKNGSKRPMVNFGPFGSRSPAAT